MKILIVLFFLILSHKPFALTVSTEPWIDPGLVEQQIQPLLNEFKLSFVSFYNLGDFSMDIKKQGVDLYYVGSYFHDYMINNGYSPVLVSKQDHYLAEGGHCKGKARAETKSYYYLAGDLFTMGLLHTDKIAQDVTRVSYSTAENIIIRIIKDKFAIGLFSRLELQLLPEALRKSICILRDFNTGPLILYARNKSLDVSLISRIKAFHNDFSDDSGFYLYLNSFKFVDFEKADVVERFKNNKHHLQVIESLIHK